MAIPKFYETWMPILKTLSDGETIHRRDLPSKMLKLCQVPISLHDVSKSLFIQTAKLNG